MSSTVMFTSYKNTLNKLHITTQIVVITNYTYTELSCLNIYSLHAYIIHVGNAIYAVN